MPISDPQRVYDGFSGLAGGQDSGRRPSLIGKDQCARAENMVFRGGAPTTRPGFTEMTPTFITELEYTGAGYPGTGGGTSEFAYLNRFFQTACYYSTEDIECFMVTVGGRLFQIVPGLTTYDVTEIDIGTRNRQTIPINYMIQADTNLIVQDGESAPIIFDGVVARRAGKDEIFTGTIMTYGMGRIVLVRDRRIFFGDIFDGKGNGGDDCLQFTETRFLNEGFATALPSTMGRITGAQFFAQQDTSTGTGDLMIFGENGAESFFLSIPREQWKDSGFQKAALLDTGAQGHRAIVQVNEDLWFRSQDGWRSYRQARAQVNYWSQIPLSTAVRPYTESDTSSLLDYGSAIHFNNRLIVTSTPQPNGQRLYHNGFLSLDFDVLSSFGRNGQPAWDGHWTGVKTFQIVHGNFKGLDRAFAFGIGADGNNALFEITYDETKDTAGSVPWELVTRSMDFESEFNEKELYGMDTWIDDVREPVEITAQFRADQKPDYSPWGEFSTLDAIGTPSAITPGGVPTMKLGYSPRKSLGIPPDSCDSVRGKISRRGFEFQTKLNGTGHCCLRKLRLHAKTLLEQPDAVC